MQRLNRADLHVHSRFSDRSPVALLRPLGCQECFTEPAAVYAAARRRGMDLSIAEHPGALLSTEPDTWFQAGDHFSTILRFAALDRDRPRVA